MGIKRNIFFTSFFEGSLWISCRSVVNSITFGEEDEDEDVRKDEGEEGDGRTLLRQRAEGGFVLTERRDPDGTRTIVLGRTKKKEKQDQRAQPRAATVEGRER